MLDVQEYAVTVIGRDRPGIIADTTEVLARLGLNLTDSTMTRLRGHFAMTLICAAEPARPGATGPGAIGPGGLGAEEIDRALSVLTAGAPLVATVRAIEPELEVTDPGVPYILTVHGADRLGIVAALTRVVAGAGGNVTDLNTRLAGQLYVLAAEVDLPVSVDRAALGERLQDAAARLGVEVTLRPAEADLL